MRKRERSFLKRDTLNETNVKKKSVNKTCSILSSGEEATIIISSTLLLGQVSPSNVPHILPRIFPKVVHLEAESQ